MKQFLLIPFIILALHVSGQSLSDSIRVVNNKFYQHNLPLTLPQLQNAVSSNTQAYQMIKSARGNATLAAILSYPGGFLIGYPLGTAIGGGKPNWTLAGIGAGLILIAIPISLSAQKKTKEAVKFFNSSLSDKAYLKPKQGPEINFGFTQNGVGVIMKF